MTTKRNREYIPKSIINQLLINQNNKCANNPDNPALNLSDYNCCLWILYDGDFDEAGFEIDHIDEHCISADNTIENIQLLCPNCHSVKTKKFMHNKRDFTTREMASGRQYMDIDIPIKKKRKI